MTFRNSGTPVRSTRRRKSQKMHFQEFWDSCAQNKASEISKKMTFRDSGTPVRRTRRRKYRKCIFRNSGTHKTSEILNKCTFKTSRTPVRPPDPPKSAPRPRLQWLVSFRLTESLTHRGSPAHTPPSPRPLTPNPPTLVNTTSVNRSDHGQFMSTEGRARARAQGPGPALCGHELVMVGPID